MSPPERRVAIRVLGAPHVSLDGSSVALGARSMMLLLRLSISRSVAFTSARLRDEVWGDATRTESGVRVQVNRVRALLGTDVIVRRHDGYALGSTVEVDVDRFEALCGAGRDRATPIEARIR